MDAIDENKRITDQGRRIAALGVHPRVAAVALAGGLEAAIRHAIVPGGDDERRRLSADLTRRLRELKETNGNTGMGTSSRFDKITAESTRQCPLLAGFPDRLAKNAEGASWTRKNWPIAANGELISALDGNWAEVEKHVTDKLKGKAAKGEAKGATGAALTSEEITQAARDSVRAIMMIRAYRMRGHLHANLDPLGLSERPNDYNELEPENYGFTPADYNRKIFIDFFATWCGPCKLLAAEVFPTAEFKKLSKNLVFCKIDVDQDKATSQAYNITAMPTQMVVNADGSVVTTKVGYGGVADFFNTFGKFAN